MARDGTVELDGTVSGSLATTQEISGDIAQTQEISGELSTYKDKTSNYEELVNKPSINEVELIGNKTFDDLGDHTLSNIEIKTIFNRVFKGGQNNG